MRSLCTTTKSSLRSLQLEKAHTQQWRPNVAKNKQNKQIKYNNNLPIKPVNLPFIYGYIPFLIP